MFLIASTRIVSQNCVMWCVCRFSLYLKIKKSDLNNSACTRNTYSMPGHPSKSHPWAGVSLSGQHPY